MKKIRSASLKIGKVIHDELRDILDIYPVIAPQNTNGCFGVYRRESLTVENTKDIYNICEIAVVEIAIIAPSYIESLEKSIDVKFYLEHLSGKFVTQKDEYINVANITLVDSSEEYAQDNYLQILKFEIKMYDELNEN